MLNAGKYASSIIAVWLRYNAVTRSNSHNSPVWILAYTATAVNIFYALYWDFFMDWTIIEYNPSVKWRFEILPRRTLVKSRTVWAFAVAFNVLARSAGVFAAVPGLPLQHAGARHRSRRPGGAQKGGVERVSRRKRTLFKLWCVPSERRFAV